MPRQVPFAVPFNQWSANRPGTSYFLPVNEFTAILQKAGKKSVLLRVRNARGARFVIVQAQE